MTKEDERILINTVQSLADKLDNRGHKISAGWATLAFTMVCVIGGVIGAPVYEAMADFKKADIEFDKRLSDHEKEFLIHKLETQE